MNTGEAYICLADNTPDPAKPEGNVRSQSHSFTPLLSTFAGDRWRKVSEGIFTQVWSGENPPGEAGFKIRLSVQPPIADEAIRALVPIVVHAGCPFKVIANTALLELACSKWTSEESAGDFMTVYPPSQVLFNDLTAKLQHAIRGLKSSHVPMPVDQSSARTPLAPDNPWPGRDCYLPEESAYFFGREDEQVELAQRIERATLTVVLGQPGVGKSSLLRAGLKPQSDRLSFQPVYLRLQFSGAVHPVQQVRDEINRVLTERRINGAPFGEGQTLREYFHPQQPGWVAAESQVVVPVLIFDQFEDVFAVDGAEPAARNQVEALWTQIANLVENRGRETARQLPLPSPDFRAERNLFKVVIGLRQDYLPELLARRGQMPSIAQNHFVLKPFNGSKAVQAVLGPGRRFLDPASPEALAEQIVRIVGRESTQPTERPIEAGGAIEPLENVRIEPALLSFFCQQLNEARKRSGEGEPGARVITAKLLHAEAERIIADFFHRAYEAPSAPPQTEPQIIDQQEPQLPEKEKLPEQEREAPVELLVTQPQIIDQQEPQPPEEEKLPEQEPEFPVALPVMQPQVTDQQEPQALEEEKIVPQESERPGKELLPVQSGEHAVRRLKYVAFSLCMLLIIILAVMVVTHFEDIQREQTEAELEEYISNLATTRNTFKSAQKEIALAESNLALKESNLLVLTEQARQQQLETRAAREEYSRLAGEQTNFQSRIAQLNAEKTRAESRLAQWSSLLNDLTNQIASLTTEKQQLEARARALALAVTNNPHPVTNPPSIWNLSLSRPASSNAVDQKQAAALLSASDKLLAPMTPDTESSAQRNADFLLTHGQCLYSEAGMVSRPVQLRQVIHQGGIIKTGEKSWCDFFIRRAGVTVRLAPDTQVKIAKLSVSIQNGIPVVDTLLELTYGRIFTVVRALVPGSTLEISDFAGRSVIEGGGLGDYMITAPGPDTGDKLTLKPLRIVTQNGTSMIAPSQAYSAKDGATFSLGASTWEATLIHLDELEAEADSAIAEPEPPKSQKTN